MSSPKKLSLSSAIIVNVNIMLGSGIFVNAVRLAEQTGGLGGLVYGGMGLVMLPLIRAIAILMRVLNGGTFYEFGSVISQFWGFTASWGYFAAKLASCALGIHIFLTTVYKLLPQIATMLPLFACDIGFIVVFTALNVLNVRIGSRIQSGFILLKLIPIMTIILSGLAFFSIDHYTAASLLWEGIPASVPFVLFAFSGFEASCSMSRAIENPEKNGPRAIFASFGIVLVLMMLFQTSFFGILGGNLASSGWFAEAFSRVLIKISDPTTLGGKLLTSIVLGGIASSALGGAYGIMYSNCWNLYTLAEKNHLVGSHLLSKLNRFGTPYWCVIAEGFLAIMYITLYFSANPAMTIQYLQQTGALASIFAYTISACAFMLIARRTQSHHLTALGALITCTVLWYGVLCNLRACGAFAYVVFTTVLCVGLLQYVTRKKAA